jgi:hypothetical protein
MLVDTAVAAAAFLVDLCGWLDVWRDVGVIAGLAGHRPCNDAYSVLVVATVRDVAGM